MIKFETDYEKLIVEKDGEKSINWDVVGIKELHNALLLSPINEDEAEQFIDYCDNITKSSSTLLNPSLVEMLSEEKAVSLLKTVGLAVLIKCRLASKTFNKNSGDSK